MAGDGKGSHNFPHLCTITDRELELARKRESASIRDDAAGPLSGRVRISDSRACSVDDGRMGFEVLRR